MYNLLGLVQACKGIKRPAVATTLALMPLVTTTVLVYSSREGSSCVVLAYWKLNKKTDKNPNETKLIQQNVILVKRAPAATAWLNYRGGGFAPWRFLK